MRALLFALALSTVATAQTIEGYVVNAATGAAVPGARIVVSPHSDSAPPAVRADASGYFRVDVSRRNAVLPMDVSAPGFLPKNKSVQVKVGQTTSPLRIELTPVAVIHGTIRDEDGFPVENATVAAMRYLLINGVKTLSSLASSRSDDLGRYDLAKLPPGRYWIRVSPGNTANWDRRYITEYLPGTVNLTEATQVELRSGQELSGVDVRLSKHEGVTVSGRLDMPVAVTNSHTMFSACLESDPPLVNGLFCGSEGMDGTFVTRHVPPGDYVLRYIHSPTQEPEAGGFMGEVRFHVGDEDIANITVPVREVRPVDLTGVVRVEEGGAPPPTRITLRSMRGQSISTRSSEDGSFVLKGVLPVYYYISSVPDPTPALRAGYTLSTRLGDTEVTLGGFDLHPGPPPSLQITLSLRAIEMKGKLVDPAGQPVANATLAFLPDGFKTSAGATTLDDGSFKSIVRRPGEYHVYLVENRLDLADPDFLEAHKNDFPPITIIDGDNPPLTLRTLAK